ncbi:external scaffolding protein [Microviridae sp.]|nr:external scaffolding protein [Microviridae sp.]
MWPQFIALILSPLLVSILSPILQRLTTWAVNFVITSNYSKASAMNTNLDLATAKNAMHIIAKGATTGSFDALGIGEDEFQLVVADEPWLGTDRPRVTAVLDALTHGVTSLLALPSIQVPGEFRASVLAMFVSPCNLAVACRWVERTGPSAGSASESGEVEEVTARQLFAMCIRLHPDASPLRATWEKTVNRQIQLTDPGKELFNENAND